MDETARQKRRNYWDEKYRDYWIQRVAESNAAKGSVSHLIQGDKLTASDKIYLDAIELLKIPPHSTVLEMGCGFGRSIPFLQPLAGRLEAIDISEAMIQKAREEYGHYQNVAFHVSEAERTPFSDKTFDDVVCFAVFDAVFQSEALVEMNRITRKGGRILITGKNNNYFDDDEEASVAEIHAREKEHPNFFTDVSGLMNQLDLFGFRAVTSRYFLRRGDFSKSSFESILPAQFYEYLLIFEKEADISQSTDFKVADPYSLTWHRRNGV